MRRRVFIVAGEYSANPRDLPVDRRRRSFFAEPYPEPAVEQMAHLFFRFPNRSDDGRTRPADWERAFGLSQPIGLADLFASAGHRALTTLNTLLGGDYARTRDVITDMLVTSMPGLDPNERMNIGLLPQALQATLGLPPRTRSQFVVGTSDSGASAFAQAVRAARTAEEPATILVLAGQIIPSGYVSQYQIRTVLGEDDQSQGLDMLAVGDLVMDIFRRNFDLRPEEIHKLLDRVARRKQQTGANYPAGINAGRPYRRDAQRTPWFDAADIAVPCCGAAATIITSDERIAEAIAASRNPRFRTAPLTEVLGVGDGSSNQNLLQRKSPLIFATAVRAALSDSADDAGLPISAFASCAFGVVHDAFPSIELSFLLSLGLGWERSAERIAEGWSNPVGGLLSFGHALGASGLVQVNKAHHVFCVDSRYLMEPPGSPRQGFRSDGALAFTTSVGGPLSHIVCGIFRGGDQDQRPPRQRAPDATAAAPLSQIWSEKREQLRLVLGAQLRSTPGKWLVEGTTWVSIRSSLRALSAEDVARLQFEGLEELVAPESVEELRQRLRVVVRIVQQESDRVGSMFDAFRLLTDEVRELAAEFRRAGKMHPDAAALDDAHFASALKECLRVPFAVLYRLDGNEARRLVRYLPQRGVDAAALTDADFIAEETLEPLAAAPEHLPFWNARARRPRQPAIGAGPANAAERVQQLVERGPHTAAELELLRAWFALDLPRALLDRALREAGAALPEPQPVRAVFYLGEIADPGRRLPADAAHEVVAWSADRARAYFEAYESSVVQAGPLLSAVAFERAPQRSGPDAALFSAARFAQEVARAAFEQGVFVRAAVCLAEGAVFEDVNGRPSVASQGVARAYELLKAAREASGRRPAFVLEGASPLLTTLLEQRLSGWERTARGPAGAAIWLGPPLDAQSHGS